MDMPDPATPAAKFMAVMVPSGWMAIIGFFQLVGGLLVLIGGTAPLGLCILGPIIVNILIFHLHLTAGHGIAPGLVATLLEVVLIYAYRANFAGIFTYRATPTV